MLIDPYNRKLAWIPVPDAVVSGLAYAVDVRAAVLPLDSDAPELVDTLARFAHHLHRLGLKPVVLNSGRPGHQHLLVVVADPSLRRNLALTAQRQGSA